MGLMGIDAPENNSGVEAMEYNVIVKIDKAAEKTSGGLLLTDDRQQRDDIETTTGTIVSLPQRAYDFLMPHEGVDYDRWIKDANLPGLGERVLFPRYAGIFIREGRDGMPYRVIKDKDVIGRVQPGWNLEGY